MVRALTEAEMRLKLLILGALLAPAVALAAPFCVVDDRGKERCSYHSMESCRDAARWDGGACLYRPNAAQAQDNPWDWGKSISDGLARGEEKRSKRELHDLEIERQQAEIDVLRTQTASAQAPELPPMTEEQKQLRRQCDKFFAAAYLKDNKSDPAWEKVWECRNEYRRLYPNDPKRPFGAGDN
jgi:hypothetical protein